MTKAWPKKKKKNLKGQGKCSEEAGQIVEVVAHA